MSNDDLTAVVTICFIAACLMGLGFLLGYMVGGDRRDPG